MSFRRIPKEIDPRRPPKKRGESGNEKATASEPRSYGQYVEMTPEEVAELERATGEVAREGSETSSDDAGILASWRAHREIEEREAFEDATDEVSREDSDQRDS